MSTTTTPKSRPRRQRPAKPLPEHTEKRSPGSPEPAGFIGLVLEPVDFELWPVQPVITWQPELTLEPPHSSGLCIDRCHRPPVPGFLDLAPDAGDPPVPGAVRGGPGGAGGGGAAAAGAGVDGGAAAA